MKRILLLLTVLVSIGSQAVIAQTHKLSGRVLDENGQPLPGATIVVKGSNIGTVADDNGNFVINNVPNAGAKIKINYALPCKELIFRCSHNYLNSGYIKDKFNYTTLMKNTAPL